MVELDNIMLRDEINWKQMARCSCLKDGDANIKYSHSLVRIRQKCNNTSKSSIGGVTCEDWTAFGKHNIPRFEEFKEPVHKRPVILACSCFQVYLKTKVLN